MADIYKKSGVNSTRNPFDVHECVCLNSRLIPSNLPGRVYTCTKCGGKVSTPGAVRHANGVIFALQTEIDIKKKVEEYE